MKLKFLLAATASLAMASPSFAQDEESGLSASIGGGFEYDSNITVDAQDLNSNQGDAALLIEGDIGYEFGDVESMKFEVGYDFYQSLYMDLSDFDMQIHGLSLSATKDVNGVDAGANYRFSHIRLDGDSFLDIHSFNPTLGKLFGDKLYVIAGYDYQNKNFETANARDADQHNFSAMGYYFFGSGKYVNFGYKLVREDADGAEFDYWAHYFDAGFKVPVELGATNPTWRTSYRYYRKDYSNVTPSIGEERLDKRHDIRTSLTFPILENLDLEAQYRYIDSTSNLESIDYTQHLISGKAVWSF